MKTYLPLIMAAGPGRKRNTVEIGIHYRSEAQQIRHYTTDVVLPDQVVKPNAFRRVSDKLERTTFQSTVIGIPDAGVARRPSLGGHRASFQALLRLSGR